MELQRHWKNELLQWAEQLGNVKFRSAKITTEIPIETVVHTSDSRLFLSHST